ncbi:hypothetical protein [Actinophytocola gossypii]|uniref:Uncharacterized protein n=1 Tax=Actinophytocola gossypii TaxID=2812003 RepID=A0ABT2J9K0_9PSEU|nr:hypothetical protein [Actinophytocola gossypii]MCT2583944.1 hypothetical protein [Actinophytocola gossypii]
MTELDENDPRWTDEARESFRVATTNLVEAIRQHSATLLELTGAEQDDDTVAEVDEHLEAAAAAYADAQFELTGTVPPLGLDEDVDEDEDLDEDEDEDLAEFAEEDEGEPEDEDVDQDGTEELEFTGEPSFRLTVLHRADFVVTDEPAVVQAGKEAYHDSAEDGDEPVDVTDLSEALQQLHQAGGIEALAETPGLASAGSTTWVLEATDLLDEHDADEGPDSPFALGEDARQRLLHRLDEITG